MLQMRKIKLLSYFLDAVNVSAVGVMLAVLITMGMNSLTEWPSIVIAALSFAYMFLTKKPSSIYAIIGGAVLGFILFSL